MTAIDGLLAQLLPAQAWVLADRARVWADGVVDTPEPEDVKAGWTAFALFGLLVLAVALLARSLVTRLRNAQRAADAGLYDESDPGSPGGAANGRGRPRAEGSDRDQDRRGEDPPTE